ncbi:hypothetical protein [Halovivax cerinus]|uniref:Xylanase/chitin deacetylase n=1 Tax=Halovivax cerinus TaxID=1487865 RepID=A0ABD5NQF9_9EURY|nr:hypothetical protein [Halovivax cerinus]
MTRDFTYEIYEELLQAGLDAGYEHITVREYLDSDALPERFIIHRHDVDRKPENSLAMARLEAEYDIPSTYYFRTIDKTFQPELIREIEDLGHEIGYHYEDMDRVDGNVAEAHASFATHLERLREHATIDTVCMHGNPLTAHDNRDMWTGDRGFDEYGLLGEAYLSMDFVDVTYFSDTGRTWEDGDLKVKDHPVGESSKTVSADGTAELIELVAEARVPGLCLLSHPNRWAETTPEYVTEYSKDAVTNVGKRMLNLVR